MGGSRYVDISRDEFFEFITDLGFHEDRNSRAMEHVFSKVLTDETEVCVFSSIHISNATSRDVGKDAIRVVVMGIDDDGRSHPIWKAKRVHRTKNWRDNLSSRLDDAKHAIHPTPCPKCGNPLVLRTGQYGEFYSCSMWAKTKCDGKATTNGVHDPGNERRTDRNGVDRRSEDPSEAVDMEDSEGSRRGTSPLEEPRDRRRSRRDEKHDEDCRSDRQIKVRQPIRVRQPIVRTPVSPLEENVPVVRTNKPQQPRTKKSFPYNEDQLKAINHGEGPIAVFAGPGSGKTRTIIGRIARLLDLNVSPEAILATTFTTKAAGEMNERLREEGVDTTKMQVSTMHSFCYSLLRRFVPEIQDWSVDDEGKYSMLLKHVIGFRGMNWKNCDISLVEQFISLAKNALVRPTNCESWETLKGGPYFNDRRYIQAYFEAEELRRHRHILTFDDMLIDGVELLKFNQAALDYVQSKYEWVIVDEFQDSNIAQVELMELVSAPQWNTTIVGDEDQAIYQWRGAFPKFMIDFPEKHNAKVVVLKTNYRSCPQIVNHSLGCIVNNKERKEKELNAHRTDEATINCRMAHDLDDEAEMIADNLETMISLPTGIEPGDCFVLYRTNAQSRAIEEVFSKRKIPHIVFGAASFYQRKEVQDLLAYLYLILDPDDYDHGKRALGRPFRYISALVLDEIDKTAGRYPDMPYLEILENQPHNAGIFTFVELIKGLSNWWRESKLIEADIISRGGVLGAGTKVTVGHLLSKIVNETGFVSYLAANEGSDTAENSRAANIGELIRSADRYLDIGEFLKFVAWQIEQRKKAKKKNKNAVQCMTIHRCVHPSTIIETDDGLIPIKHVSNCGKVATADGPKYFRNRISYTNRKLITLRTKNGYEIVITSDHEMMTWNGSNYIPRKAEKLNIGDFLRLRLGVTIDPKSSYKLPDDPCIDIRASRYNLPSRVNENVAEFFGLMVADGTIYKSGFRLKKCHEDVRDRFAELTESIFGCFVNRQGDYPDYSAEVNSTFLSSWLLSIDGLSPNRKGIPTCILRNSQKVQSAFLRGLFEDGTAKLRSNDNTKLDHVAFHTKYRRIGALVQFMLLRQGIISTRFEPTPDQWRVSIYGSHAHTFREVIGFVSSFKNERLLLDVGPDTRNLIPINRTWVKNNISSVLYKNDYFNAINRGHISRNVATKWGLGDALKWHHDKIVSIKFSNGPAMCIEVPNHGRFLQNGFDGSNSKGLESEVVYLIGANNGILPHAAAGEDSEEERRLFYVAITRAKTRLHITAVENLGMNRKPLVYSKYIDEAGIQIEGKLQTDPVAR